MSLPYGDWSSKSFLCVNLFFKSTSITFNVFFSIFFKSNILRIFFFADCMTHGLAQNNEIISLDNYNDGECHDEFNNYLCNFDGGDCCSPYSSNYWCNECLCIWENPTYPVLTTRDASKFNVHF